MIRYSNAGLALAALVLANTTVYFAARMLGNSPEQAGLIESFCYDGVVIWLMLLCMWRSR